jgi:Protein of unknown function (DUF3011)
MTRLIGHGCTFFFVILVVFTSASFAQGVSSEQTGSAPATTATSPAIAGSVSCASGAGQRTHCDADTSEGVALVRSTGTESCLLGKSRGYNDTGVWVSDGCSGEFAVGQVAPAAPATPATPQQEEKKPTQRIETWGEFDPGEGFLVGRTDFGELAISGYGLLRYVNQMPPNQTFVDHLGNEHPVDARNDIFPHRIIIFLRGWVGQPKLIYNIILWTVNTTDQDAIFVSAGYQFTRRFSLYAGINGTPGTRSLQGSHPYWLGQTA